MTDKGLGDLGLAILMILFSLMVVTIFIDIEVDAYEAPEAPEIIETDNEPPSMVADSREAVVASEYIPEDRAQVIYEYLVNYGSPIPEIAYTIVNVSQQYEVDPYVITAINCQESSCFKNCYHDQCGGYGITDTQVLGDTEHGSKEAGIVDMISRYATDWGGYYKECDSDINCISLKYNNRDSWRNNVSWFYNDITK